jgi:hypothetical protein
LYEATFSVSSGVRQLCALLNSNTDGVLMRTLLGKNNAIDAVAGWGKSYKIAEIANEQTLVTCM